MPTVINNGCTYRIVKTYHCGCEYEYAPPAPKEGYIDLLLVGGGGGARLGGSTAHAGGGGGGGGGFLECFSYKITPDDNLGIVIGAGGEKDSKGGDTCFGEIIAYGGGSGNVNGGSGGGGTQGYGGPGLGCEGQGYGGGTSYSGNQATGGGGGGGAGAAGGNATKADVSHGGTGGNGKCSCISGECLWYAGGGGGGGAYPVYGGTCGGTGGCGGGGNGLRGCISGNYDTSNCDATYYGGGGGGGGGTSNSTFRCMYGKGYQGVVILRYKTDGSCGIKPSSTGGCKYECGDYTIHCFTANDTFTPVYK